jgi:hypothetical protein
MGWRRLVADKAQPPKALSDVPFATVESFAFERIGEAPLRSRDLAGPLAECQPRRIQAGQWLPRVGLALTFFIDPGGERVFGLQICGRGVKDRLRRP